MDYTYFLKENIEKEAKQMVLIPFDKEDIVKENKDELLIALYREEAEALYMLLKEHLLHKWLPS